GVSVERGWDSRALAKHCATARFSPPSTCAAREDRIKAMSSPEAHRAMSKTLAVIMGGGAGTRLFPLTKDRAKPAVPLAGKYRLVDIPISNCINSDLRRIFLLTQFNSSSLHRHIQESYRFDTFSHGFVEILAAEQRPDRTDWYQGTADAVRQNLLHLNSYPHRLVL